MTGRGLFSVNATMHFENVDTTFFLKWNHFFTLIDKARYSL